MEKVLKVIDKTIQISFETSKLLFLLKICLIPFGIYGFSFFIPFIPLILAGILKGAKEIIVDSAKINVTRMMKKEFEKIQKEVEEKEKQIDNTFIRDIEFSIDGEKYYQGDIKRSKYSIDIEQLNEYKRQLLNKFERGKVKKK